MGQEIARKRVSCLKATCKCLYKWFLIYPGLLEKKLERFMHKIGEKLGFEMEDQTEMRLEARKAQNKVL
jgi:hypothetical protein